MTTNVFLSNYLSALPEFGGVYNTTSIKKLRIRSLPCYIICNLSAEGEIGSHWIAVSFTSKQTIYFDSLGLECVSENILSTISRISKHTIYLYNLEKIQSERSGFCGEFCIGFILSQKMNVQFYEFLNLFKRDTRKNDSIILSFINKCVDRYISEVK